MIETSLPLDLPADESVESETVAPGGASVGSGLSAIVVAGPLFAPSLVRRGALPRDAHVFRSGRFFVERETPFGCRIDGYFFEDLEKGTVDSVARLVREGSYHIGRLIRPARPRDVQLRTFERELSFLDVVVCEDILVQHPAIAGFLLVNGRPSAVLLMAAWCLASGYGEVHLVAPGLLQPVRFGARGAELSRDVAFLELLVRSFPRARLFDATERAELKFWLAPSGDPSQNLDSASGESHARTPEPASGEIRGDIGEDAGPFVLRENSLTGRVERCAYVTYCDSQSYFWGVRALARSLRRYSAVPLVVMIPENFVPGGVPLASDGVHFHKVPSIANPHAHAAGTQKRFQNTFSKLNVFGLSFLDKAVFLDCDALVLAPLDELFDRGQFAAAPDHGNLLSYGTFNSGLFVCQPSTALLETMVRRIPHTSSVDGGDQGFLNEFFDRVDWLPRRFNVLKRIDLKLPAMFELKEVAFLHYVGEKPWDVVGPGEWDHLERLWFGFLNADEQADFLMWTKVALFQRIHEEGGAWTRLGRKLDSKWERSRSFLTSSPLRRFIERNVPADCANLLKNSLERPWSLRGHARSLSYLAAHRHELAAGLRAGFARAKPERR